MNLGRALHYITKQHSKVLSVELKRKSQVVPVYTESRGNSVAYSFTAIVTELAAVVEVTGEGTWAAKRNGGTYCRLIN